MTIDPRSLRDAFGSFMTGVTVVTTMNPQGKPIGFTANSFTSVSLDPPLLLVCLSKNSYNKDVFKQAQAFAINILSEDQKDVSNTFARRVEDRFAQVDWSRGPNGSPVLDNVAAWFDCVPQDVIDAGDHYVLLGRVRAFGNSARRGLGYVRGSYLAPAVAERSLLSRVDGPLVLSLIAERDGRILMVDDPTEGWTLPFSAKSDGEDMTQVEQRMSDYIGVPLHLGQLYSVYEDREKSVQHVVYRAELADGELVNGRLLSLAETAGLTIPDYAISETVKRFVQESSIGNFGVYVGNNLTGSVHAVTMKKGDMP